MATFWQYLQKPYLEPKPKSMMEFFPETVNDF